MSFKEIINNSKVILTEGAIVERLKAECKLEMDPHINHAGLIYTHPEILTKLYSQYIDIAQSYNLPIMLMTPTRRVNYESLKQSSYREKPVLKDACSLLINLKESYQSFASKIMIGGLVGCKGDAYSGKNTMSMDEAYYFHKNQILKLQREKIDFLMAGIMPEIEEAIGMSQAMAESGLPYIISFMIRKDGCLLDGTPIAETIELIDKVVNPQPIFYMTNCVHPTNLISALNHEKNRSRPEMARLKGIQANASILSPEELNNCNCLHQDDFNRLSNEMMVLNHQFKFNVLGGCCGTDDKFIKNLSLNITNSIN